MICGEEMVIMTSIMQSIKPQYCEFIAVGKKTIEVRKTRPKLKPPFKVYIYCTKSKEHFRHGGIVENLDDLYRMPNGEIKYGYSGELMCCNEPYTSNNFLNGKVICEYICDEIQEWVFDNETNSYDISDDDLALTCLTQEQLWEYGKGKTLYGYHISDLKIYDEPKELNEFYNKHCDYFRNGCCYYTEFCHWQEPLQEGAMPCVKPLIRPFQSWGYVYEID